MTSEFCPAETTNGLVSAETTKGMSFAGLGQLAERTDLCSRTSYARYGAPLVRRRSMRPKPCVFPRRSMPEGCLTGALRRLLAGAFSL
jgi:hypothetical protein